MKEQMLLWSELNHEQLEYLESLDIDERFYYEWYFTDFQIKDFNKHWKRRFIQLGIIQIGFVESRNS